GIASTAGHVFANAGAEIFERLGDDVAAFAELVDDSAAADGEEIGEGIRLVLDRGRQHDGLGIEGVADGASAVVQRLGEGIDMAFDGSGGGCGAAVEIAGDAGGAVFNDAGGAVSGAFEGSEEIGSAIVHQLRKILRSYGESCVEGLAAAFERA